LLGTLFSLGCSPGALFYFLFTDANPTEDPLCKLSSSDREVKVVILTSLGETEIRPELLRADRELSERFAAALRARFKENKEKVTVIPPSKVHAFKDRHPEWATMSLQAIGKHFEADYVLNLDISAITLYLKGSNNFFYQGHAEISVAAVDVNKTSDEAVILEKQYTCDYPKSRPIETSGSGPGAFRALFLEKIARDLTKYFAAYPTEQGYECDEMSSR
jgi:hypothetical protein